MKNLQELTFDEQKNVEGGIIPLIVGAIIVAALLYPQKAY